MTKITLTQYIKDMLKTTILKQRRITLNDFVVRSRNNFKEMMCGNTLILTRIMLSHLTLKI